MAGNLQVFLGAREDQRVRGGPAGASVELLWIARLGLLVGAGAPRADGVSSSRGIKRAARPIDYTKREPQVSTLASRTMRWGGVLLLVFIVFHILHFTTGTSIPSRAGPTRSIRRSATPTCTATSCARFRIWWVALFYVVAMVVPAAAPVPRRLELGPHAGLSKPSRNPLQRRVVARSSPWSCGSGSP